MSGEEEEVVGGIVVMDAAAAKSQGSPNCGFHLMAALVGLSSPLHSRALQKIKGQLFV